MPVCSREGERQGLGNAADVHAQTDSGGAVGQFGTTALHWATLNDSHSHSEMAELLLGAGASVDAKTKVRAGCCSLGAGC